MRTALALTPLLLVPLTFAAEPKKVSAHCKVQVGPAGLGAALHGGP